jgi:3-hydroxybutyryl-CoA dehydratase
MSTTSPSSVPIGLTETHEATITEAAISGFAQITGDYSEIHLDEEYARQTRFKTRIAHGALLVGYVSTVVAKINRHLPPPGGVSYRYDVKFVGPARLGDTVTTRLIVREAIPARNEVILDAVGVNQADEAVLKGTVVMKLLGPAH